MVVRVDVVLVDGADPPVIPPGTPPPGIPPPISGGGPPGPPPDALEVDELFEEFLLSL